MVEVNLTLPVAAFHSKSGPAKNRKCLRIVNIKQRRLYVNLSFHKVHTVIQSVTFVEMEYLINLI